MAHDPRAFFTLAQMAIGTTQKELGERLGISRRTAQRYSEHGVPHEYLSSLVREVQRRSRPRLRPPPPPPADGVVDAVVCAAAEANDAKPGEVRRMLLAAFSRAREIGIDTAFVERVLRAQLGLPSAQSSAPPGAMSTKGSTKAVRSGA